MIHIVNHNSSSPCGSQQSPRVNPPTDQDKSVPSNARFAGFGV